MIKFGPMMGILAASAALLGIYGLIFQVSSTVYDGTCTPGNFVYNNGVGIEAQCGDHKIVTKDGEVVFAHIKNSALPIHCTLHKWGKDSCSNAPAATNSTAG